MTTKLNQRLAVAKGIKASQGEIVTKLYQLFDKGELTQGFSRTYRPIDDESTETFPPEHKLVQTKIPVVLDNLAKAWTQILDTTASIDFTNASGHAKADVVVNGVILIKDAPATFLISLEKTLADTYTVWRKIPVVSPDDIWNWDGSKGLYATEPYETTKTKKTLKAFVKAEATDKHPAQVETYQEDVPVGYWTSTKLSGAITPERKRVLLERIQELIVAVKEAREKANSTESHDVHVGDAIFGYLLS